MAQPADTDIACKVVVLGQAGVGKSSVILRYCKNVFNPNQTPSYGSAFSMRSEQINNKRLKFNIWDTAGQERYAALAPQYIRNSNIILAVFEVITVESFERAKQWVHEANSKKSAELYQKIAILANKSDEPAENWKVAKEQVIQYGKDENIGVFFTSAKLGDGIVDVFKTLGADYLKNAKLDTQMEKEKIKQKEVIRTGCC